MFCTKHLMTNPAGNSEYFCSHDLGEDLEDLEDLGQVLLQ